MHEHDHRSNGTWTSTTLGAFCKAKGALQTGPFGSQLHASDYSDVGVPVVMPQDISHGRIHDEHIARVPEGIAKRLRKHALKEGDVVFSRRGEVNRFAIVSKKESGWLCGTGCLRARLDDGLDPHFLGLLLDSHMGNVWLLRNAVGQTMLNLNTDIVAKFPLSLPSPEEQTAIADLVRLWHRACYRLLHLIKARRKLKQGLLQQLLTGERRFPGFRAQPWRDCRLRDVAAECNEPGRGSLGRDRIMGVTKKRGIVPMEDRLIGSVDRYQVVRNDWFAYNPMRLNIGSIARWYGEAPVLVSPDYVVFRCLDGELDPGYLDQYRRAHQWQSFMRACGAGSVRVRIYFNDLGRHKMHLPPIAEQRRIAEVLNTLDREIQLLTDLHRSLREQKNGLMQKLLTGQLRVPTSLLKEAVHA